MWGRGAAGTKGVGHLLEGSGIFLLKIPLHFDAFWQRLFLKSYFHGRELIRLWLQKLQQNNTGNCYKKYCRL